MFWFDYGYALSVVVVTHASIGKDKTTSCRHCEL